MSNADIDIIVRSQAEWDALPSAFDRAVTIYITKVMGRSSSDQI